MRIGAGLFILAALWLAVPPSGRAAPLSSPLPDAPVADPHVITLRADPSCPSNCDPASDHPGYDIEIAKAIYEPLGYKVDYRLLSWARTLVEVRRGTFDALVAGIRSDAPDFIFPREPAGMLINGFALRKGSGWQWRGPQSLQGMVLGYIPDYQYFPALKDYIDAHAGDWHAVQGVAMMNATALNLKKLLVRRIDITCDDLSVLRYERKRLGLEDQIEIIDPKVAAPLPNYIAFGPHNPRGRDLARQWDEGIRRLRASGRLAAILDRYGIADWE